MKKIHIATVLIAGLLTTTANARIIGESYISNIVNSEKFQTHIFHIKRYDKVRLPESYHATVLTNPYTKDVFIKVPAKFQTNENKRLTLINALRVGGAELNLLTTIAGRNHGSYVIEKGDTIADVLEKNNVSLSDESRIRELLVASGLNYKHTGSISWGISTLFGVNKMNRNIQNRNIKNIVNGKLVTADWIPSPNFNERPKVNGKLIDIDTIVIHNISLPPNEFKKTNKEGVHYVKAFFTNKLDWNAHPFFQTIKDLKVSSHLFIERDGSITQFVNFNDRAWHAGKSSYKGRENFNNFSIGIEMEGSDFQPFTDKQYKALAKTIVNIHKAYPNTRKNLVGHSDIAPTRKTDPGPYFDWYRIRKMVHDREYGY